jgi:hypothetical protein
LRQLPLSLPIICVAFGFALFSIPGTGAEPDLLEHPHLTERLTELIVIVALMGAGLKLNRPPGWQSWIITWRLLAITMPLSIAGIALLGWWGLGLAPAAALLLGAVLAPTDPVLASDVQVGPPHDPEEDDVRFSLTSEAGSTTAWPSPSSTSPSPWPCTARPWAHGRWSGWPSTWYGRSPQASSSGCWSDMRWAC